MINFFRKFRQRLLAENKFSKYLLYAIGEIVLVVVGILIALQINTWNQGRNREQIYLGRLKAELETNINRGNLILYDANQSYTVMLNHIKELTAIVQQGLDTSQLIYLNGFSHINSVAMSSSVFEEGMNTGELTKLKNAELLSKIQLHYTRVQDIEDFCAMRKAESGQYEIDMKEGFKAFQSELMFLLRQTNIRKEPNFWLEVDSLRSGRKYWEYLENAHGENTMNEFVDSYNWLFDRSSVEYKSLVSNLSFHTNTNANLVNLTEEIIRRSEGLILEIDKELVE